MRHIQLTIQAKNIKTKQEAEDFGCEIAEHLMETFNDDGSLAGVFYKTVPLRPPKSITASHQQVVTALKNLLEMYIGLVHSGECGHWDPEKHKEVIAARVALANAKGEA
jgi:hypothetical protein